MIDIIRNGKIYSLDDGTYCHYLGDDGFGMAPLWRITSRAAEQHGETDHDYRLRPRLASLKLGIPGTSRADLYARRAQVLGLFNPTQSLSLRWTIGDTVKQIDMNLARDLSMPSVGRRGFYQEVVVTLTCPDPTFYDPEMKSIDFGSSYGSDTFTVPMPVPHGVGSSSLNESVAVPYDGSWISHPIIRIEGPITNPILTNLTTGDILDFTGTTISGGSWYEIDCRFAHKTVVDNNGTNRIDKLTDDSDLATWHLEPDPDIGGSGWTNSVNITGSAISAATIIRLRYYERYIGL